MKYGMVKAGALLLTFLLATNASAYSILFPEDNTNLQHAIDSLSPGDTVLVEPGHWGIGTVYLRSGITVCSQNGDPVTTGLRGWLQAVGVNAVAICGLTVGGHGLGSESSELLLSDVVFAENSIRTLYCESSDITALHVEFERNDRAVHCLSSVMRLTDVDFEGNVRGLSCEDSQLALSDVAFRDNGTGGGLYASGSNVTMTGCVFESNEVGWLDYTHTWWEYGGKGGGACLEDGSTLTARDVVFNSNHTWQVGGGLALLGSSTCADISECTFISNTTSTYVSSEGELQKGAGLYVEGAVVTLDDVWFCDNWCNRYGGALYCEGQADPSHVTVRNCVFKGNSADLGGGAYGAFDVANCTFVDNSAPVGGAVYGDPWGDATVCNSILCCTPDGAGAAGVFVTHCCIWSSDREHEAGERANMYVNPLFCSSRAQDYSLCSDSPCLPRNNEWRELVGARGEGCGPCNTPVEETSWGSIKAMYWRMD